MTQQNQPPHQREHQANERTFLAWLRTSISLIGLGLAIRLKRYARSLLLYNYYQ